MSAEELELIAFEMRLDFILPEWMGANLLIKSIPDLTLLPSLTRFQFPSGAVVITYAENDPCIVTGRAIEQFNPEISATAFPRAALGRRGLVGWTECPGLVRQGDLVSVEIMPHRVYQ